MATGLKALGITHSILCLGICSAANPASCWLPKSCRLQLLGRDFGAIGARLASKIQLSCEYWYFLKEILQIFAFCLRVGKRGKETSQGKRVILEAVLWSLDLFSSVELTILEMISLSTPACTTCLSFCLTVLSTVTSVPAKTSQLLIERSCGTFFISCKKRNSLLWLQMPVLYQRFRSPDHFFQSTLVLW